jgi:tRNA A37 threonylcarbamoyltransferase TsaD
LRKELAEACKNKRVELRLTERSFCTDNAAMIAILAERKLRSSPELTSLDSEVLPSWDLA